MIILFYISRVMKGDVSMLHAHQYKNVFFYIFIDTIIYSTRQDIGVQRRREQLHQKIQIPITSVIHLADTSFSMSRSDETAHLIRPF